MKLTFDQIDETDAILIRTQNSEYRFRVTDPDERRGILSGGSLGAQHRDATLVGAFTGPDRFSVDADGLSKGSRALFYLAAKAGVERLITSVITDISHMRGHQGNERAA